MESKAHVLLVPYSSQGHINPMLQFGRRLASKGVKVTLAITNYLHSTLNPTPDRHVGLAAISDGFDEGGFGAAGSVGAYLDRFRAAGSESIHDVIERSAATPHPITCLVYDAFLPWALDAARRHGLAGGPFFTQACAVNFIYLLIHRGKMGMPTGPSPPPAEVPGLPPLGLDDMPSFVAAPGEYPAYLEMVLDQCRNLEEADFVLVNTFHDLEAKVIDEMSRHCRLLTIGPTVPSHYLDRGIDHDKDYGLSLYPMDATACTSWLSTKPPGSVLYVSFGSMACLSKEQTEELAWGLEASGHSFLWVVRGCEEGKLPEGFRRETETGGRGLVVGWAPQLEVLASGAVGCFFTHCGWNSTLEALCLGVPLVGMPQWTDQPTDAKLVEDVWGVGVRVRAVGEGVVRREEVAARVKEVMVGERRKEVVESAKRWMELAREAISQGGSSDRNVDEFVSQISKFKKVI